MELISKAIVLPDVPRNGEFGLKRRHVREEKADKEIWREAWAEVWEDILNEWGETVRLYENEPEDFYNAWHYLNEHPAFWRFRNGPSDPRPLPLAERLHVRHLDVEGGIHRCVDISVVKVNAETRSTEDGPPLETEVWIELGQQSWPKELNPKDPNTFDSTFHDYLLDCGGPTVEAAVIKAARNVWEVYGNDRRVCDGPYNKAAYLPIIPQEEIEDFMKG